jgi:hypothetical protein
LEHHTLVAVGADDSSSKFIAAEKPSTVILIRDTDNHDLPNQLARGRVAKHRLTWVANTMDEHARPMAESPALHDVIVPSGRAKVAGGSILVT